MAIWSCSILRLGACHATASILSPKLYYGIGDCAFLTHIPEGLNRQAIPLIIVEPAKLVALAILGGGHWVASALVILPHMASAFWSLNGFLGKLMALGWFAKAWNWFTATR